MKQLFSLFDPAFFRVHDFFEVKQEDLSEIFAAHSFGVGKAHSSELERRDDAAEQLLAGAKLWSGIEGTSLGAGGIISLGPSILALFRTLMRVTQSIAWVYDSPPNHDEGRREVWKILLQGMTRSPGLSVSSGILSGQLAHAILRRLSGRVLSQLGVSKSPALLRRMIPLAGALAQGLSNASLTSEVGQAAKQYYREKFLKRFTIEG
jgi:hypothetical protein